MTPHNSANPGDIAGKVIMAGDPLRVKFIAENYLENPILYNQVRGMLGYTGTHDGKTVSIQGHGMGIPSIGIYSYELFAFYGVDTIIRVGTCGALQADVKLGTIILAEQSITDSNYGYQFDLPEGYVAKATPELIDKAEANIKEKGLDYIRGTVFTSDVFYNESTKRNKWMTEEAVAVEMEAYALYTNAAAKGRKALTILTVSDNTVTGEEMSPEQRQTGLRNMIELALSL